MSTTSSIETAATATAAPGANAAHVIAERVLAFLAAHATDGMREPLRGGFALHRGRDTADLYGMIDAVYILHTLGELASRTDRASRRGWTDAILACQDDRGWFSRRNHRGHRAEHATAYAIGAMRLLEVEPGESHVERVRPLNGVRPLLRDHRATHRWLRRLGFERWSDALRKDVGWNHVWRGSHVAGGVAAAVGETAGLMGGWWGDAPDGEAWLHDVLDWLDREASPRTGYWQRAWWNLAYRRPTVIDLGGAAHFAWIYEKMGRPVPHPEAMIESTLSLQRETGFYREKPFCLDLDADFCLIRPLERLPSPDAALRRRVEAAVQRNFAATAAFLAKEDLPAAYGDSHGLPGALAALTECMRLDASAAAQGFGRWQHVLDRAWWL